MTDYKKMKVLLDSFDVEYLIENRDGAPLIVLEAKTKNVIGYSGFLCEFYFNPDEKFKEVGIWE